MMKIAYAEQIKMDVETQEAFLVIYIESTLLIHGFILTVIIKSFQISSDYFKGADNKV